MGVAITTEVQALTTLDTLAGLTPTLWLRPEELVEDYGMLAEDTRVVAWRDASGNGRNLRGDLVANWPKWKPTSPTSNWYYPGLWFSAAHSSFAYINNWASDLFGVTAGTVFVVGRADAGNAGPMWIAYGGTVGSVDTGLVPGATIAATNADSGGKDTASLAFDPRTALPAGGSQFGLFMWRHDATNVSAGCSLAPSGLDDAGLASIASGSSAGLSALLYFGINYGASAFFEGVITEVLVFNTALTQEQRRQVARYVRKKYGIPESDDNTGSTWTTLPDVIASAGVQANYGMGNSVVDRVAGTGQMSFVLNNSEANSAGLVGYYTPSHANSPAWWDLGTEIRLAFTYGGTTYYKWRGYVDGLDIQPGSHSSKRVGVRCVDWMDVAARSNISGATIQLSKRSDEVVTEILSRMSSPPPRRSIGYGSDTYAVALDNSAQEEVAVMSELQRLANSELGYVFMKGDIVGGGTLAFESRMKRGQKVVAAGALTDASLLTLESTYSRDDIINDVLVQIYPRRTDITATAVLFRLQDIPALSRNLTSTFFGPFRDPDNGRYARVGGTGMVAPEATTDYTFNTAADGSGTDLTTQLTVLATYAASGATIVVTNNGPLDGYLTKLQVRGKGVYTNDSLVFLAEDRASQRSFGRKTTRFEMPYQSNPGVGLDAANFILNQGKDAAPRLRRASFLVNDNAFAAAAGLAFEISERVTVTEAISGVVGDYFINGVDLDVSPGGLLRVTWTLVPADSNSYWILQTTGFTELGDTTRLSYGLFSPQWQLDVSQLGSNTYVNA